MRPAALWPALVLGAPLWAQEAPPSPDALPSGQSVLAHDMTFERQADGELWLVLRYIAPRIAREGGDLDYDDIAADLDALCAAAAPHVAVWSGGRDAVPDQIMVSLMDRPVPRGVADPDARIFIAAYGLEADGCVWR
jgi:hypothetical protein